MPCRHYDHESQPACAECEGRVLLLNFSPFPNLSPTPEVPVPTPVVPPAAGICPNCEVPTQPGSGNEPEAGCTCGNGNCRWCCGCYECTGCTAIARLARAPGTVVPAVRHTANTGDVMGRGRAFDRCIGCGTCQQRCACPVCSQCRAVRRGTDDRCTTCLRGRNCCGECRCGRGWDFYKPKEVLFHHGRKSKRVLVVRLASLEVETNQVFAPPANAPHKLMDVAKKWKAALVEDGSVNAFELNTAPASGHLLDQQLKELTSALSAGRAQVGENCGVHCHVDARDFHYWDMRRMALLWRVVEGGFYQLADPSRRENHYCVPSGGEYYNALVHCKTTREVKAALMRSIYSKAPDRGSMNRKAIARGSKYGNGAKRYNCLNLHSWFYRGTVENRMLHATTDYTTLLNWALLNAAFVECAYTWSEAKVRGLYLGENEPSERTSLKALRLVAETVGLSEYVKERAAQIKDAGDEAFLP